MLCSRFMFLLFSAEFMCESWENSQKSSSRLTSRDGKHEKTMPQKASPSTSARVELTLDFSLVISKPAWELWRKQISFVWQCREHLASLPCRKHHLAVNNDTRLYLTKRNWTWNVSLHFTRRMCVVRWRLDFDRCNMLYGSAERVQGTCNLRKIFCFEKKAFTWNAILAITRRLHAGISVN